MLKRSNTSSSRSGFAISWPLLTMLFGAVLSAGWAAWDVYGPGRESVQLTDRPIQDVRVGERVWGTNPHRDDVDRSFPEPDEKTWRLLRMVMHKADGNALDIELLRPLDWIADHNAVAGQTIELDLPELGAQGPADVLAIGPCPPIQSGPGQVVTGTFAHQSSRQILNVQVESEREPIGVTDNHPIWSETRQEFVEAGKLTVGEELLTLDGTTKVTAITPRGPPEPVYNLEVHGEHVYHVAASGVLVHNSYTLRHGTDLASAEDIASNGLNSSKAKALGGSGDFWTTSNAADADFFAKANPAGGAPAKIRIDVSEELMKSLRRQGLVDEAGSVTRFKAEALDLINEFGRISIE